jgi:glycosyltransferase involved in cell wall biosynthesis
MKVLLIHNFYKNYGGEETAVLNKIKLLESNNITVKLFSKKNDLILSFLDKVVVFFTSIFSFKTAKELRNTIKEFEPDIIEVHNVFPLISPSIFFTANKMKIPVFYYLHNYRFICGSSLLKSDNNCCDNCKGNFFKAVINRCYRNSFLGSISLAINNLIHKSILKTWTNKIDYFFIMNKNNIKYYTKFGIDGNKIIFLPHFSFMQRKSKKDKKKFALFVGEFSAKKGIHTLIKAFRDIDYKLKLIGKVKNKNSSEIKSLKKLNINLNTIGYIDDKKNIENIGFVDNKSIAEYYANASFTIFPSEWEEPFGYVLIESFANYTPVLGSDQASIKKIVKNNFNGILFKSGNYIDLKNKIKWMIENEEKVSEMALNAKKDFDKRFSPKNSFYVINKIYHKAIIDKKN